MRNRIIAGGIICLLLLGSISAQGWAAELVISGSTTIQPVAQEIGEMYLDEYGERVLVEGGGSGMGVQKVIDGSANFGAVSRKLTSEELELVDFQTIGHDALVFIVNEDNPLTTITKEQVRSIFSGELTVWTDLTDWERPIVLINKELGRATLDLFEEYSELNHWKRDRMGEKGYVDQRAYDIGSNLEGCTLVGGIPGAIGYVSMGTVGILQDMGMPIKALELDRVEPTRENVINGRYPIVRDLNLVYKRQSKTIEQYLGIVQSPQGQEVVYRNGFIPIMQ